MTMKHAKEGYPEPVPGVLVYSRAVAQLAISTGTRDGKAGVVVRYISVYVSSGKYVLSECFYGRGDFPWFAGCVVIPPPA
jgi:hypothetical protein